ncbi:ATP-binding cassette domain-containing protein [Vibrio vulnificus]|uniref:ATP-binding cassette domain-containing protein n=1 Tax=Vibrio vulnificus TaxID=672 RepID=UPI002FBD57C2
MPVIHAQQLSYQLNSGEWLFHHLDFQLAEGRTALVGRNGVGKSLLLQLLVGQRAPTSGQVVAHGRIGYYSQQASDQKPQGSIAQYLGVSQKLNALKQIEKGSVDPRHFEQLEEDWQIEHTTQALLDELRITQPLDASCQQLSGGQLAMLTLKRLFLADNEVLILDEPSNHLDHIGKQWLIEQIRHESRPILLVSHDRALLMAVDRVVRLTSEGLHWFDGHYAQYQQQWQAQQEAVTRKLNHLQREQKAIQREIQKSKEKAQKRESQGKKKRASGSQPKILTDGMKNSAESRRASANIKVHNQLKRNQHLQHNLKQKLVLEEEPKLYLSETHEHKKRTLLNVTDYRTQGLTHTPLSFQLKQGERCRLFGANGVGKSRLLKALTGLHEEYSGEICRYAPAVYLDQHYQIINLQLSLLENLTHFCSGITSNEARLLLAGIGFRRDSVDRQAAHLSGGEKMKLAMLMVSHVPNQPLLLLDEPDNHLDLESKQALAHALAHYQGALILVSHDDHFVAEAQITRSWHL